MKKKISRLKHFPILFACLLFFSLLPSFSSGYVYPSMNEFDIRLPVDRDPFLKLSLEEGWTVPPEEECAGGVVTGNKAKDGRSIFWKNRHMSGQNNMPAFYQGPVYKYYGVGTPSGGVLMGLNEKGLALGNFAIGGTIDHWTHYSDATYGQTTAIMSYLLGNFDTVGDAALFAAQHMGGKSQLGIISEEYGVGAVVASGVNSDGDTVCHLMWVNDTALGVSNRYLCDGDVDPKAATVQAMFDDILANGGINGNHLIDWEEVVQRGGKNVRDKEQGEGTFSTSSEITKPSCVSGFVAVSGDDSYNGAISMAWLAMGRQPLVGVWLPLGASYVDSNNDIPSAYRTGGGIEDYVDVKVAYASTCGAQGCATYYCDRTREVQNYTNHNEDYSFDKYDELMETIMTSANQAEAESRLESFADSAFDVVLYAYEHEFKTPFMPLDADATAAGPNRIDLTWTKGEGSIKTIVERNNALDWEKGEGIQVYDGIGESHSDTGLSPGTNYYYQLWSYSEDSGGTHYQYSLDHDSADATTSSGGNSAPVFSSLSISDGATGVPISTSSLSLTITDPDGDSFDWSITTSPSVGSHSGTGELSGVKSCSVSGLAYDTTYTWTVSADDGTDSTQDSFTFTTEQGPGPIEFDFSRKATIDHDYIDNALSGFPVLVHLDSDSHLADNAQADGDDISFWSLDGNTQYSHEIEYYDSGSLYAWVSIPSVSASSDTEFWLKYGNDDCDSQEDPNGVWSSFAGVWHLSETNAVDSTGNGNTGVPTGSPTVATGKVYDGVDFAPEDYISLGTDSTIDLSNMDEFTVEFWVNFDTDATQQMCFVQSQGSDSWNIGFGTYENDILNNDMKFLHRDDDGNDRDTIHSSFPGTGSWHYITGTYYNDGSDYKALYTDGSLTDSTSSGINNLRAGPATYTGIGHGRDFGPMDGKLDEVRMSKTARSAAWVKASYYTVQAPDFLSVAPAATNYPPILSSPSPSDTATGVSVSLSSLGITITDSDGDSFDWSITTSPSIGSHSGTGELSGVKSCSVSGLAYDTIYTWTVSADDGTDSTQGSYSFTTEGDPSDPMPHVSLVSPSNGGSTTDTTPIFSYKVSDGDNTTVSCSLYVDNSLKGSQEAVADGSTVTTMTLSTALSYDTHQWFVRCDDGSNSDDSPTWSITVKKESSGGGGGNGGGGNGGGGGDTPPSQPSYNVTYNLSHVTEVELQEFIETTESLQQALLGAGFDVQGYDDMGKIAVATKEVYENCFASMWVTHPDTLSTEIVVKFYCSESTHLENVLVFIEIPKSFAASSEEVTVSVVPSNAGTVMTESDLVYSFQYEELTLGDVSYAFHTSKYLNRGTIAGDWTQPLFFIGGIGAEASQICGNSIKEEGEECDGDAPSGYRCIACKLELSPGPQCVDDMVCSAEEELLGNCRDCWVAPVVLPDEFVPAFLWVRASAGTLLLLGALVLLGAVVRLWMKRKKK